MRFEIGNHGQAPFKVFLRDGREITDQIDVKELTCHVSATGGPTVVKMTVYADSVHVLSDQVEVSIVQDALPFRPRRFANWLKRLFTFPRSSPSLNKKPIFTTDGL